jgi:hypothetical protein
MLSACHVSRGLSPLVGLALADPLLTVEMPFTRIITSGLPVIQSQLGTHCSVPSQLSEQSAMIPPAKAFDPVRSGGCGRDTAFGRCIQTRDLRH